MHVPLDSSILQNINKLKRKVNFVKNIYIKMDKTGKFLLPSPKFEKLDKGNAPTPHFLSPQGMLLPKTKQPPPMYGPRGATFPPKFLIPQPPPITNTSTAPAHHERVQHHFCEPCKAQFHTLTDYKVHKSEHVQCEIDECEFRGHPAFMDTHICQEHATGLYEELKKLSSPEEIAQWRAERKKNYPTVANVLQKWRAREQRMIRGERLEASKNRFGRQSDRRKMGGDSQKEATDKPEPKKRHRTRNRGRKHVEKRVEVEVVPVVANQEKDEEPTCNGLVMFKGTAKMSGYKKVKPVEKHALSSLLGMYGSDSEEETISSDESEKDEIQNPVLPGQISDGEKANQLSKGNEEQQLLPMDQSTKNEEEPTESIQDQENESSLVPTEPHLSDDEAPEEAPIEKASKFPDKPQPEHPSKKRKFEAPKRSSKSGLDYKKLRLPRQNTLLEKLLEPDIRHERNVLLQCVRFVVENNFFGIGSPATKQED